MSLLNLLKLPPPPRQAAPPASGKGEVAARTTPVVSPSSRLPAAAEGWRKTHATAAERMVALKKSVQAHYAGRHPDLLQEIDQGLARLDKVLDKVDIRLADALAKAAAAVDDSDRRAALAQAKSLLAEYINYVKSEPLIAHMDNNPFGVKTDLKALLAAGLTNAAKAVG